MKALAFVAAALTAACMLAGGAAAANVCVTPHLQCTTTMPTDGFCQCTARGATEDGSVKPPPPGPAKLNSTAGGCGAEPNSAGCKASPPPRP